MSKLIIALCLAGLSSAHWVSDPHHQYSAETSNEIAQAIKEKLLNNLGKFSDQKFADQLKEDLNTDKDSDRNLKELSPISASQLFGILGLDDPKCDENQDGTIKGDQLKCLNFAWKAYLPQ